MLECLADAISVGPKHCHLIFELLRARRGALQIVPQVLNLGLQTVDLILLLGEISQQ